MDVESYIRETEEKRRNDVVRKFIDCAIAEMGFSSEIVEVRKDVYILSLESEKYTLHTTYVPWDFSHLLTCTSKNTRGFHRTISGMIYHNDDDILYVIKEAKNKIEQFERVVSPIDVKL